MTIAATTSSLPVLPAVLNPQFAVFTDFDESFLAHRPTPETRRDLHLLKQWLMANVATHEILFGFVTGSNSASVMQKLSGHPARFLPHFVGSSLGSELHHARENGLTRCPQYSDQFCTPQEFEHSIALMLSDLEMLGVALGLQSEPNQGAFKRSFYFRGASSSEEAAFLSGIALLAGRYELDVICAQSNPAAGDPEGAIDVDFIPAGAGKAAVAKHILETHNIAASRAWAFGDSGNDVALLKLVGNPFCLANATPELHAAIGQRTTRSYAGGILEVLTRVFG